MMQSLFKQKLLSILSLTIISVTTNYASDHEGFYIGTGQNTYLSREQVKSGDGAYNFSHSTKSPNKGFLTQSLGNYGYGVSVGFRKNFDFADGTNIATLEAQYYYNYQNVTLESTFDDLHVKTTAEYNHGYRIAIGHKFKHIHPYIIIQGIIQTITPENSMVNNNHHINDVEDDGTILDAKISTSGKSFTTDVFSYLGAFGFEVPLNQNWAFNMEYIPMKHVEYGLRDKDNQDNYFVNNLVINQIHVGIRYFLYNPFK